ncbi:MAG: PorT family protein [Chitinophagaceae bacterium]|nr:MAG: PorT family protein [Chitinophagaceae bacterium]
MQSVNDDMDDLWRKAAGDYPLNTAGADWDKVAAGLGIAPEPKRRDRRYLWLLLLLLIPVLCIRPFPLGMGSNGAEQAAATQSPAGKRIVPSGDEAFQAGPDRISTGEPAAAPSPAAPTDNGHPAPDQHTQSRQPVAPGQAVDATPATTATTKGPSTAPPVAPSSRRSPSNNPLAVDRHYSNTGAKTRRARSRVRRSNSTPAATVVRIPVDGSVPADTSSVAQGKPPFDPSAAPALPTHTTSTTDSSKVGDSTARTALAKVAPVDSPAVTVPAVAKKPVANRSKRFYAGIVGGMGITTVKRQKVQAPGYDMGLALGYQFSRHFAIEANVLWSRKHYYSHGKYLKNDLSYLPQYSYVRTVDGDCRMIEIPVNLQYHFRFRKRGNWFATAGFSSYLMKREEYGYDVKNLFTSYEGHYDTTLRNATRDWMAMLQLSAGCRFQLRRQFSLRVEPYVQLPVQDAGAGRLPLTSYGLRVALLKNIF